MAPVSDPPPCDPPIYYAPLQVGFRHTEVLGARLIHNGRPIALRGVNRHEFDPRRGKALTEEDMIKDVGIMKRVR